MSTDADGTIKTLRNGAEIVAAAAHRNGVSGVPFHVAIVGDLFGHDSWSAGRRFLVVTFDDSPAHTAVFDLDELARGEISFAANSWRGDVAADICRDAILRSI